LLESLIRSVLERDGKAGGGESTVVALHCQQMREWGVRGGNVELRPIQDDDGQTRLKFFQKLWENSQLQERLDNVMDNFVCRGEILWYFQPDPYNPGNYIIEYFVGGANHPDPQFKVFYKKGGREIEKAYIRYSYEQETPGTIIKQKRWVRIVITQDWIEHSESLSKPDFDWGHNAGSFANYAPQGDSQFSWMQPSERFENPFKPYLPIIVSKNNASQLGQPGSDDFYWVQNLVETHEQLVQKAHKNLRMFSNPILVTTRSAQEVMQQTSGWSNTWASANRYVDMAGTPYSGSTNPADAPSWGMQRSPFGLQQVNSPEGSLSTIFGNVGDGERFAFIQADAVSGDQNLWIRQLRELIHWILGGVDPLSGISAGATFGEVKTLFGRVQNTAEKKGNALFGQTGLSKVFERILWREERLFKLWLLSACKHFYPREFSGLTSVNQLTDEMSQSILSLKREGKISLPNDYPGISPLGDRRVTWRYTREVFQNTTREELDRSIAARNEREDGLSQEWVLRKQYPNMTDQEIRNAMSGFSPRVVQNATVGIQSALQLYNQFMQLPDPTDPDAPWGIRLGLPEMLEQSMSTLRRELAYGQPSYEPADEEKPLASLAEIALQLQGVPYESTVHTGNGGPSSQLLPELGILNSMGLPGSIADAATGRLYRAGYESAGLRGQTLSATSGTAGTGYDSTNSVFGGQLYPSGDTGNWGTGTPLGTVGSIQPELLTLYANQLRRILAAAADANPSAGV
jgi:hypothetical protein